MIAEKDNRDRIIKMDPNSSNSNKINKEVQLALFNHLLKALSNKPKILIDKSWRIRRK